MKYVYMIRAGQGHYKVGVAKNVTRRIKELQTSNPTKMEVITTRLVDHAYRVENLTHMVIATAKSGPSREWFELTPEQVIEVIIFINQNPEIDMTHQITVREILAAQDARQLAVESNLDLIVSEYRKTLPPPFVAEERQVDTKPKLSTVELIQAAEDRDLEQAKAIILREGRASTSMLQRWMRIGYGRAARTIEKLEHAGFITTADGNRPRHLVKQ